MSRESIAFENSYFYSKDGSFDSERAKDATIALMQYHNCPVYPNTREQLFVSDYGVGSFATLGLACVIYVNNVPDRYMQLDIFLLPGQMLAEHWHIDPEDGTPAKREGWLVRWGRSYIVGVGDDNLSNFGYIKIPKEHCGSEVVAKSVTEANPGEFTPLKEVYSKHWQYAGDEGAIITEVANCHSGEAVRHSDPTIDSNFRS